MAEVTDTKDYPTMAEIVQLARVYSEGVVADEYKQTLPIPALVNGEPSISLFTHLSRGCSQARKVLCCSLPITAY